MMVSYINTHVLYVLFFPIGSLVIRSRVGRHQGAKQCPISKLNLHELNFKAEIINEAKMIYMDMEVKLELEQMILLSFLFS